MNFSHNFRFWCIILLIAFTIEFVVLVFSVVRIVHFRNAVEQFSKVCPQLRHSFPGKYAECKSLSSIEILTNKKSVTKFGSCSTENYEPWELRGRIAVVLADGMLARQSGSDVLVYGV
jgi:hypothetical protein